LRVSPLAQLCCFHYKLVRMARATFYSQIRLARHLLLYATAIFAAGSLFSEQAQTNGPRAKAASSDPVERASQAQAKPTAATQAPPGRQQLERLSKVADKVLDQIQAEENDLYLRLNYFEKPERLDPSSFASKDEIAQWRGLLEQLKQQSDKVAERYANVAKDLDGAFKSAGTNEGVAAAVKKFILDGFPWDQIEEKKRLIADFIEEHGNLLTFYEKNWGSWVKTADPGKPQFTSTSASNIYKRLRDQIVSTGDQIQKEYKSMSE
jgi:hypothetical protein